MKNKKGFTLIEVIISIGLLGIVCAVMLRMFTLALNTNRKASRIQEAEVYASSAAEVLMASDTLYDALDQLGINRPDSITDWQCEYEQNGYNIRIDISKDDVRYPGTLYGFKVSALYNGETMSELSTMKYYGGQTP